SKSTQGTAENEGNTSILTGHPSARAAARAKRAHRSANGWNPVSARNKPRRNAGESTPPPTLATSAKPPSGAPRAGATPLAPPKRIPHASRHLGPGPGSRIAGNGIPIGPHQGSAS